MSNEEFRDDLREVIQKHSGQIDAEELESAADGMRAIAEDWRSTEVHL